MTQARRPWRRIPSILRLTIRSLSLNEVATRSAEVILDNDRSLGWATKDILSPFTPLRSAIGTLHALAHVHYTLLTVRRVTILLNSRSHSTELATAAQSSQSRKLKLTVENACCKNG